MESTAPREFSTGLPQINRLLTILVRRIELPESTFQLQFRLSAEFSFIPSVYITGDKSGQIQKRRDIISLCLYDVCLSVIGAVQHAEDDGQAVEVVSQLHADRQFEGVSSRVPEAEVLCDQACVVGVANFVGVHQVERHRAILQDHVAQVARGVLRIASLRRAGELETIAITSKRQAHPVKMSLKTLKIALVCAWRREYTISCKNRRNQGRLTLRRKN